MSVPQQLLLTMVRDEAQALPERYAGYRQDLMGYLAEILSIERAAPNNVVQQVEAQVEALAELFARREMKAGDN